MLRLFVVLVALLGSVPPPVSAQRAPQQRQELERRIRQQFERRVREQLDLTQDQFRAAAEIFQDFRRARTELQLEEREVRLRMQRFVVSQGSGGDEEASEILAKLRELQEREQSLYLDEEARLLEHLTPSQLVQFNQLRTELASRIQQLRRGGAPGRRNGGPGGLEPLP